MNEIYHLLREFWLSVEVPSHMVKSLAVTTHCIIALGISGLIYIFLRKMASPMVTRIVQKTHVEWDHILFNPSLLHAASFVIFTIVLHLLFPPACRPYRWLFAIGDRVCQILLVVGVVRLVNRLFLAGYELLGQNQRLRMQPLKGLVQMLQLICIIVGIIICVSIVIDKNPGIVLGSLGASAAVLMLVFKDTILGVVAGVQLSANDMLRKGDWIVVPNTPVNGVVQDVTLTTVKVQNFDNTILTVPPYTLISGSFQNWRGMSDSGGRRIMRSVMIDVKSVRFCTDDEISRYKQYPWFARVTDNIDARPVNLTVFRYYLEDFIKDYVLTNTEYTYMVRQLEPTTTGIPVQLYCFTSRTDWKEYEHVQADIFDHIYAMISVFGLRIFQSPSAEDLRSLKPETATTAEATAQAFNPEWLKEPQPAPTSQPAAADKNRITNKNAGGTPAIEGETASRAEAETEGSEDGAEGGNGGED